MPGAGSRMVGRRGRQIVWCHIRSHPECCISPAVCHLTPGSRRLYAGSRPETHLSWLSSYSISHLASSGPLPQVLCPGPQDFLILAGQWKSGLHAAHGPSHDPGVGYWTLPGHLHSRYMAGWDIIYRNKYKKKENHETTLGKSRTRLTVYINMCVFRSRYTFIETWYGAV